jgi:NitT/TauT family transport system substrate-binding protein
MGLPRIFERLRASAGFLASRRALLCWAAVLCIVASLCGDGPALAERLRIGAQKSGTFGWELAVIKARGLDKSAGLDLDIVDLANTDAGKIAISGGSVDIILSDWLWVSRERGLGHRLTFAPYSSAVGAVMAKDAGPIASLADLKGKTLGVAGGPLDKSWLLLKAFAKRSGFDIEHDARILFGAPPLLAEKAAQGELDATLQFWNFCADLEQRGFRRVIDMQDVEKGLGASGPVAMVGYVFDEDFAARNAAALTKFFEIARQAKEILATDDKEWPEIMTLIGQKDPGAAALYRKRYSDGVPRRPIAEEEADARVLFKTLAEVGGQELVGPSAALDPGAYYKPENRN